MGDDASLEQIRTLMRLDRWAEALDRLDPHVADPASGAEPWRMRSRCLLVLRRPKEGLQAAERAVALDPADSTGHALVAINQYALGRMSRARRSAERAVLLDPFDLEALNVAVMANIEQRRVGRARTYVDRATETYPGSALTWQMAATVSAARRHWKESEANARRGLAIDPQDAGLLVLLGTSLQKQRRSQEASEAFAAAARSAPDDDRGRRALGKLGLPAMGLGFLALKGGLIKLLFGAHVVLRGVIISRLALWWVALGAFVLLAACYGAVRARHARTIRQLRPEVRDVARRARREHDPAWLVGLGLTCAAFTIAGLLARDGIAIALFPVVGVTAVVAAIELGRRRRGDNGLLRALGQRWAMSRPGLAWAQRRSG
jgi:tetratricopeptide (TPR) repeat protein